MPVTLFLGSKSGVVVLLSLFILFGVIFSCKKVCLSNEIIREQKQYEIMMTELDKKNNAEISGFGL